MLRQECIDFLALKGARSDPGSSSMCSKRGKGKGQAAISGGTQRPFTSPCHSDLQLIELFKT